jgi:nitrite reductase (NADH) small subunit
VAQQLSHSEKIKRGAADAGAYFRSMMQFVGFGEEEAAAIRSSRLVIEKYIPRIVADFYTNLLRYPPTRAHFLLKDGSIDQPYLQTRMHHLTNFWRRTASGYYDDEYARYVDYVGRAHTSHGADPNIYIAERYVIGQVGFIQHAIGQALSRELHEFDPDLEERASKAWNMLMMVILEMLARAYREEHAPDHSEPALPVNPDVLHQLAIETYELGLGLNRPRAQMEVLAARVDEIPEGERKIIQAGDLSVGVFHHKGGWYALRNHCQHRGGPVATGLLEGETLTCPWHGYQYEITTGKLLVDPSVKLDTYPVTIKGGNLYVTVPEPEKSPFTLDMKDFLAAESAIPSDTSRPANEFLEADLPEGKALVVQVGGEAVAVFHTGGQYLAVQEECTHAGGPLSEGSLDGRLVTCPWHGSCFDLSSGAVRCGPARDPLKTYRVTLDSGRGIVEAGE